MNNKPNKQAFWKVAQSSSKNWGMLSLGKIATFIISFALMTALANLIPKEIVGSYNYIVAILAIVSITTLPGMNQALVRSIAKGAEGSYYAIAKKRVLYGAIGAIIAAAIGFYYLTTGNQELGYAFLVTAPFVPITDSIHMLATVYWQGKQNFRRSSWLLFLYRFIAAIITIPLLFFVNSLLFVIIAFMAGQAIAAYIIFFSTKPTAGTRDSDSENLGFHITLAQVFKTVAGNVDKVIVWQFLGPIAVAIYVFAFTPMHKMKQLLPIDALALPKLSTKTFTAQTKQTVLKYAGLLFLISLPLATLAYFAAPPVYSLLFPAYPESVQYFQALMIIIALSPALLLKSAFVAFGKQKAMYLTEVITPVMKITLMLILIPSFGIWGIVTALIAAHIIESLLAFILFSTIHPHHEHPIHPQTPTPVQSQ